MINKCLAWLGIAKFIIVSVVVLNVVRENQAVVLPTGHPCAL